MYRHEKRDRILVGEVAPLQGSGATSEQSNPLMRGLVCQLAGAVFGPGAPGFGPVDRPFGPGPGGPGLGDGEAEPSFTEISSTSKMSVAFGPIMGPAPRSP